MYFYGGRWPPFFVWHRGTKMSGPAVKDKHCYTATSIMSAPVCDWGRNVIWHGCKIELKMIVCLILFEFASCRHACFRFLHVGLVVVDRASAWPHALILNIGARCTLPWTALLKVTLLWLWKISFYSSWGHPLKRAGVRKYHHNELWI